MALEAPTALRLDYEGDPGTYYLQFTGVASAVYYRAYCSPLSTVSKTVYTVLKRWTATGGAVADSIILDTLPDWPHVHVVMTASDVNDANESAASATASIELSL